MVSVLEARYLTLAEAARIIPGRPHCNTIRRWADKKRGYNGIVLESWRVGNRRVTSVEAIDRFIAKTSGIEAQESPRILSARHQAAEAFLTANGV